MTTHILLRSCIEELIPQKPAGPAFSWLSEIVYPV